MAHLQCSWFCFVKYDMLLWIPIFACCLVAILVEIVCSIVLNVLFFSFWICIDNSLGFCVTLPLRLYNKWYANTSSDFVFKSGLNTSHIAYNSKIMVEDNPLFNFFRSFIIKGLQKLFLCSFGTQNVSSLSQKTFFHELASYHRLKEHMGVFSHINYLPIFYTITKILILLQYNIFL